MNWNTVKLLSSVIDEKASQAQLTEMHNIHIYDYVSHAYSFMQW